MQLSNQRLRTQVLNQDITALHGLGAIANYSTTRPEATPAAIETAYQTMRSAQQLETERQVLAQAAADAARQAEWDFHNAVLAMKEVVRGQYGLNSDEAQSVGLKKKANYKRPNRRVKVGAIGS